MHINTKYAREKNGGSLNFIFISLPNPIVDEKVGLPTSSAAVHLWKMTPHMMLQSIQTFCEQQIYWTFPPLLCMDRLSFYYFPLLTVTDCELLIKYYIYIQVTQSTILALFVH